MKKILFIPMLLILLGFDFNSNKPFDKFSIETGNRFDIFCSLSYSSFFKCVCLFNEYSVFFKNDDSFNRFIDRQIDSLIFDKIPSDEDKKKIMKTDKACNLKVIEKIE